MKIDFLPRLEYTWAAIAVGAGTVIYGAVSGGVKKKKATKEASKLQATRPKLGNSQYAQDQVSLAESELSTGVSGKVSQAYEEGADKDFSSSLSAILKGGGDVNNVGDLFSNKEAGRARLSLMQENLRLNQITNLQRAQTNAESDQKQQFEFNNWMPWADAAQGNAQAREQAQGQINNSINSGIAAIGGGVNNYLGQKQLDNYFKVQNADANAVPGRYSSPSSSVAQGNMNINTSQNLPALKPTRFDWNQFDSSSALHQ